MPNFLAPPPDPLMVLGHGPMSPEEIAAGVGQEPVTDADLALEQNQMGARAPFPASLPPPPQSSPQPNNAPGLNVAQPHRSFLQKALPFLPAVAGLGMAALGKSDSLQAFGAGLAGGSMNSLAQQALQRRDEEHQQSQHQLKNLDDLMAKLRQLDDPSDPRQHHAQLVVQDYDNALASGKMDGRQIQRLLAAANSVGPVESMVAEKQQKAQLSQYEQQKQIEDKLRRQGEQQYTIGGQQVTLSPHDFAQYQIAKERDRASMDRFLQAQANQDRRAGFGVGGGDGSGANLSPDMDRTLDDLVQKVTSGQLSTQNAVSMLGHGPSAYPLHRELALRIANAHLMIMPEKGRQRLQEIDTSLNYLNQAEKLGEKVSQAQTPEEFISAVDQYKSFIQGTTAVLPRAFGDRGNLAAVEGDRALSSLPNWEKRALFPQHSRQMIANLRNFIQANRQTVTDTYSTQYDETGGAIPKGVTTGNSAAPTLPPPPGGSSGTTRKQGKDGNWYEKVNGQWHLVQ